MSRSLGVLTLDLVAKTGGFEAGMDKAERTADKKLKGIERQAQQRAKAIEDAFTNMATSIAAPLAAAFSVAGLTTFVNNVKTAGVEIQRFSQLAGASAAEFQRFAHGAEKAGVPMDKFADILKDVQDKVGDFQQTGAGPLADFFEKIAPRVGLTAEAFQNLSGPQALGAYYAALEKANLSHAETTFYMEALASDASLLTPLLKDNAAGFAAAAEEADRLGLVMSDNLLAATAELDNNLKQLNAIGQGLAITVGNEIVPTISAMVGELANATNGAQGFSGVADGLNAALIGIYNTALGAVTAFRLLGTALGGVGAAIAAVVSGEFTQAKGIISMMVADLDKIALSAAASMDRVGKAGESIKPLAAAVTTTTPKLTSLNQALQGTGRSAKQAGDSIGELVGNVDNFVVELTELFERFSDDIFAEYDKNVAAMLGPLEEQARAMEEQLENYGKTEAQINLTTAARIAEARAIAAANGALPEHLAFLDREIAARERIAAAAASLEAREANDQAAADAADAWNDTAKSIESAIYDAIISGGADGGEVLKRVFKAIVLEPMIRGVAGSAANAVTGVFGSTGGSSSGGGVGFPGVPGLNTTAMLSSGLQWAGSAIGSTALSSFGAGMGMTSAQAAALGNAGLVSSGAAGAGATVAAAMPYIAAALFAAQALGVFDKKPSDKSSWAYVDPSTGKLSNVGGMTGKKAPGQDQIDATASVTALLGAFGDAAGIDSELRFMYGGRDGVRFQIAGGEKTRGAAGYANYGYEDWGTYGGDMQGAVMAILDNLVDEGTLSDEQIAQWRELKTDFAGVTRDAVEMVSVLNLMNEGLSETEIERANLLQVEGEALESAWARIAGIQDAMGDKTADDRWIDYVTNLQGAFYDLGVEMPRTNSAFLALADSLDITTEEGRKAYAGMMNLAPAFTAMTDAINAAFASITATTASSIRDIEMSILDSEGKYAYLDSEIEGLLASLDTAYDPATIQGLFEQINSKTMEAWNLLDEGQQAEVADAFISRLNEAERLATERLETLPDGVKEAATVQKDAGAIMKDAATVMQGAGQAQQQAASSLAAAASALGQAVGNIRVNVNVEYPMGSEVGGR